MGLFDAFKNKPVSPVSYSPANEYEAWIGLLYGCMSADGEVSDAEINTISIMLASKEKFLGVDIIPIYRKVALAQQKIGSAVLIESCIPVIKEDHRPMLFTMTVEIVLADGIISPDEEKVITIIAEKMKIDLDFAKQAINVLAVRNKGNRQDID